MLDAPVSGGVAGAEAGTLTFMVGGDDEAFVRGRPFFEVMGRTVVHAGGPGNGQVAKVCNNMILGISMIAVAEAFNLGASLGLEPKKLFDISSKASGSCWAMLNHHPLPGIVETAAAQSGLSAGLCRGHDGEGLEAFTRGRSGCRRRHALGGRGDGLYTMFVNAGNGGLDYSAILKMIRGDI